MNFIFCVWLVVILSISERNYVKYLLTGKWKWCKPLNLPQSPISTCNICNRHSQSFIKINRPKNIVNRRNVHSIEIEKCKSPALTEELKLSVHDIVVVLLILLCVSNSTGINRVRLQGKRICNARIYNECI